MIIWKEPFMQLMCDYATSIGKVFFPDSAQGHEMENPPDDLEVEEWSGWLVDPSISDKVDEMYRKDNRGLFDDISLPYVWVKWYVKENGEIGVYFKK